MSALLQAHRRATNPSDEVDDHHRCAWHAGAERCHYPGSMSRSTLGSGPWYCSAHFVCGDPISGAQIVQSSRGFRVGDEIVPPPKSERTPRPALTAEYELVQEEPGADG